MIKQDILEKQVKFSYLAIGSNLGDRVSNIENAKKHLIFNDIYIVDTSNFYETLSWPNKKFPKFLNIVIKIYTNLSLINLFKTVKNIEKTLGRKKTKKNYPRICDIDIIDYKGLVINTEISSQQIETPHPRMHFRNFVVIPLFELNKTWIHPKSKLKINDIINEFTNSDLSDIRIV